MTSSVDVRGCPYHQACGAVVVIIAGAIVASAAVGMQPRAKPVRTPTMN